MVGNLMRMSFNFSNRGGFAGARMRTSFNFSNRGGFTGECKPRGSELEGGARTSNVHLGFVDEPLFLTKY